MDDKLVRVHTCLPQQMIVLGKWQPSAVLRKCTCREIISEDEARSRIKHGEAKWIVVSREQVEIETACKHCQGDDDLKRTCPNCKGAGKSVKLVDNDRLGNDIVELPHAGKSSRVSTPRVPTVEWKHIDRAYLDGNERAAERIEEYGTLGQLSLAELGAEVRIKMTGKAKNGENVIYPGRPEPENNRSKGEGRDYDYGRTI